MKVELTRDELGNADGYTITIETEEEKETIDLIKAMHRWLNTTYSSVTLSADETYIKSLTFKINEDEL
mgnify:CR=1 FL=1